MKVVYNWLKDFVDVTATPDDLASRLALSGTNIGGVGRGVEERHFAEVVEGFQHGEHQGFGRLVIFCAEL